MDAFVVILAGGAGTRFWPSGRRARPKQLLPIASERTMLAETLARCEPLAPPERTFVVTNRLQLEATRRECPQLPPGNVVAEPLMRNTAAAIGLAALLVRRAAGDGVMVVLPADHVIRPRERFLEVFSAAIRRASEAGVLLTVGIRPTGPATGYGYVEGGERVAEVDGVEVRRVQSFKEKPGAATAASFLSSGRHFWNAGTFVWRAGVFLDALARHLPEHRAVLEEVDAQLGGGDVPEALYARLPNVPVDIGILERADNVEVIPADFQWDDVGSWLAAGRLNDRDANGNVVRGEHVGIDTRNCIVMAEGGHLVATMGVEDLIVVHTPDATLVCPKHRAEDVRALVQRLREKGHEDRT